MSSPYNLRSLKKPDRLNYQSLNSVGDKRYFDPEDPETDNSNGILGNMFDEENQHAITEQDEQLAVDPTAVDEEIEALERRRSELRAQKDKLQRLEVLKQEVASLEQEVHSPRSSAFSVRRPNNPSLPQDNQLKNVSVNLQDLRQLGELTKAAKEQLEQVGLDDSSDSDFEYDSKKNKSKDFEIFHSDNMSDIRQRGFSIHSVCVRFGCMFLAFVTMVLGDDTLCGPGEYHDGIGSSLICKSCAVICNPNRLQQEDCDYFCPDYSAQAETTSVSAVIFQGTDDQSNHETVIIAVFCVVGFIMIAGVVACVVLVRRRCSENHDEEEASEEVPLKYPTQVQAAEGENVDETAPNPVLAVAPDQEPMMN